MVDNAVQDVVPVRGGFVNPNEATVNLTWGQNYDLRSPVPYDISEADLKSMVCEIIRSGGDGIPADQDVAVMADFKVDRHPPTEIRPHNLITLRPKTSFG
jgi:hypothetical protein